MAARRRWATLGQILGGGGLPWRVASRLPGPELLRAWREAAGPELAARSRPVCLREDGALLVAVRGAVWRQELELLAPELLERLRASGQALTALRLVKAPAAAAPTPTPPPTPPEPLDPLQEEAITAQVDRVRDPGLRQALASLLRAQLQAEDQGQPG